MQKLNEKIHHLEQPGLVISSFGSSVAVEADNGQVVQCQLHRNQDLPVVGDKVRWQMENNTGIITAIQPRSSLLARGDHRGKKKPLAANIDAILIVMAPLPVFSTYLIDRYLMMAELLNIQPALVLNKIDLLRDAARATAIESLIPYRQMRYPVLFTSAKSGEGLEKLEAYLKQKTVVLAGPSGVGKSSLIAAFYDAEPIRTTEVSPKGTGKHTTTATRLYHLASGGNVIDSPGVRELNLWPVTQQEILHGFKEFRLFLGECRFRDCKHLAEPNCAIKSAVATGKISTERYANYQAMVDEHKKP